MLTQTTTRLIESLRDPANADAWFQFDRRYRPVLAGFGRTFGLTVEESEELAQSALAVFATQYREGRYDRSRGRLSSWLIGIARNLALEMYRKRGARHGGDSAIESLADPGEDRLTRIWARERDAAILAEALGILWSTARMEDHTKRAFELFVIRCMPAVEVARECGVEVESVYVIKNRLLTRLREIIRELTVAYEEEL